MNLLALDFTLVQLFIHILMDNPSGWLRMKLYMVRNVDHFFTLEENFEIWSKGDTESSCNSPVLAKSEQWFWNHKSNVKKLF
ncbi:hypothetical protein EPI10_006102 [Gossypium australe]|uniref:Uncharacterized protein n=1 Tax=Gossypium australe TaxID=47621 RepID=A0A5B6WSZ2_9ROSI|nr:hypothetical protein EPI10_006102 [Gossypium australe]